LESVFNEIVNNQGGVEAYLSSGERIKFPVLQVDKLPEGTNNPAVGDNGLCNESHLIVLRNSPSCPRFVALVPPGQHFSDSISSACNECGLVAHNNSGTALIAEWWGDDFIQYLVDIGLSRATWSSEGQREQAKHLIEYAIKAADAADPHDASRRNAWDVLSRILSIADAELPFGSLLSLACGYPPLDDGSVRADEQVKVLEQLANALVDDGFRPSIMQLQLQAEELDVTALGECLKHIQNTCDIPTAFARATPFYYGPAQEKLMADPPQWWARLTVERWTELLDEERQPVGALIIECTNSIIPKCKGVNALVLDEIKLKVSLPEDEVGPVNATVIREVSGAKNQFKWDLRLPENETVLDAAIPSHKSPARYAAQAVGLRKSSVKVISLQTWEPGIFIFCRSATKVTPPKKARASRDNINFEANLTLSGQGRHYFDIYVRPGVTVKPLAIGKDARGRDDSTRESPIIKVSEHIYGFEVDASAECDYDLKINRGAEFKEEILRLHLTSDETSAEGCKTEFERLIRLNRQQERSRATTEIQIDRQMRCSDLETWILERGKVDRSYFPLVLSSDYSSRWGSPKWEELSGMVFSQGRFLHDPRPTVEEMRAPKEFVDARVKLAERVRKSDDSGLIESAPLGEWLARDPQFGELVEQYLQAYLSWLEAEPDTAAWSDLIVVTNVEADGKTLVQEPDAVLVSPLHPLRFAWHCIAQRALFLAYHGNSPCPAASILDPNSILDALFLPIRTTDGTVRRQVYFAVECSSDYWSILWNGGRLERLVSRVEQAPFDQEFGLRLGGLSSGFSVSQVQRALDDVTNMLSAKPILNIMVSSAAGQNNACNEGLLAWCGDKFALAEREDHSIPFLGPRLVQIFDDRKASVRPEDSAISNLAEDTGNAIRWFERMPDGVKPDLGIIAQLETSNPSSIPIDVGSPVGIGALIRHRIRRQLQAAAGAFLCESRMGVARSPSGDGLADKVMAGIVRLENLGDTRLGYTFAPSVHSIETMLNDRLADFVAVSSSAVDPACFLGDWMKSAFLWDYDLPSYSHRAGDTNGYYLLSRVKEIDRDAMRGVLSRLPECNEFSIEAIREFILEVSRRGIPTVRGLSGGDSEASGNLGLFVAGRLLQDEFRGATSTQSLLPILVTENGSYTLSITVPVDPFRGYLEDLHRGCGNTQALRPDLLVACIVISDSSVRCKLTPIEVKFRSKEIMSVDSCKQALQQAKSLSVLLNALQDRANQSDMLLWKLGFQHLLISMLSFGFRVYSQQSKVANQAQTWSKLHQRFVTAVLSEELVLEVDQCGRLILIDGSLTSEPRDIDGDGYKETIAISASDAATIVKGEANDLYQVIRDAVGDWGFMPTNNGPAVVGGCIEQELSSSFERSQPPELEAESLQSLESPRDPSVAVAAASFDDENGESVTSVDVIKEPNPPITADASIVPTNGIDLIVGSTVDGFRTEEMHLNLSDTKLTQLNIGVVGDLGTGKTQILKSLVFQIAQSTEANRGVRPRFLIFDYKKDYSSDDFVKATGAKVIQPYKLPINLFDVSDAGNSPTPWLNRFQFFSDVLGKIYSGIGPVQRNQLKHAVRQAYEDCKSKDRQPTIYDVHTNYRALLGNKTDSPLSIIDDLVDMELFSREPTNAATWGQFLDGVVVIALDALGQDDNTKNMLVAIMLNMFYEHMLRIQKRPYIGTEPQLRVVDSYLLVDEADNIMRYDFDVLRKILLQGREFGVGVILASQYLRHFKTGATDYRDPLKTWLIHQVPNITPQELGALGLSGDLVVRLAERIKALPKHHCLYKSQSVVGNIVEGMPFYKISADFNNAHRSKLLFPAIKSLLGNASSPPVS